MDDLYSCCFHCCGYYVPGNDIFWIKNLCILRTFHSVLLYEKHRNSDFEIKILFIKWLCNSDFSTKVTRGIHVEKSLFTDVLTLIFPWKTSINSILVGATFINPNSSLCKCTFFPILELVSCIDDVKNKSYISAIYQMEKQRKAISRQI